MLFGVGMYGMLVKKNIIKLIMSMMIASYAIHMFFITSGFRWHAVAPILTLQKNNQQLLMVDPLSQTLVLISIIIGAAVISLLCVVAIRLYQKFQTFDITEMKEKLKN